ncbi:uncharacterized protein EI90DRAFT_3120944 [Cantharellus anzutake]|uniref:uncharacterized protein n=1 Tax=Cantharellus anzutake TaxID=1750568 RepID=UPI0019083AD8|nr:uncharacterized protein EI90DRAFT_3120944 [Cantharellus anzutake]KAF8335052.1 hypothetical protein EI90DRAFT_3120944 [Cantharellus anzutake]
MDDDLWKSSASAQQIEALIKVEKDVATLMRHAAASLQLLRTVQPSDVDSNVLLPTGEERSERFIQEASAYFKTLDSIQIGLRRAIAHIRERRITPSTLASAAAQFEAGGASSSAVLPTTITASKANDRTPPSNLQEARVERDAWRGIAESLAKLNASYLSHKPNDATNGDHWKDDVSMEHL